jgi:hypothetical protein
MVHCIDNMWQQESIIDPQSMRLGPGSLAEVKPPIWTLFLQYFRANLSALGAWLS